MMILLKPLVKIETLYAWGNNNCIIDSIKYRNVATDLNDINSNFQQHGINVLNRSVRYCRMNIHLVLHKEIRDN